MTYNPDYVPSGPNVKTNDYYKKFNHVRIAKNQSNRSTFDVGTGNVTTSFGALTLEGAGGVAVTGTSISSGDASNHFEVSSGYLVPTAAGEAASLNLGPYNLVMDDGQEFQVAIVADTYSARTTAEIEAAAADAPLSSTRTVGVRDVTETGDRVDLSGLVFTGRLTVTSTLLGASLRGVDVSGSENITLDGLTLSREYAGETPSAVTLVVDATNSDGITVKNNLISSSALSGITMEANPDTLTLVGTSTSDPADNLTVEDNVMSNGRLPIRNVGSDGCVFQRNTMTDFFQSFGEIQGDNWTYRDNRGFGIWARGTDSGNPHSSLFGTGASAAQTTHLFMGNILMAGNSRVVNGDGLQGLASGPKWNDTAGNAILYSGITCRYNVLGVTDALGFEASLCENSDFSHNTVFYDADYGTGSQPAVYFHDIGTGVTIDHNIACTLTEGADLANGVDDSVFVNSFNNINARPDGLGTTSSGDACAYDELFDGPSFTGVTLDNALTVFNPKTGGRLLADTVDIGAVGTYYNFSTNTASDPTWTKPITTTATGAPTDRVVFDGSNDFTRCTDVTDPILGLTDDDEITFIFGLELDAASDDSDVYIIDGSSSSMEVRHLPSNKLRIRFKDSSGNVTLEADTSLKMTSSDGFTVWTVSVKFSTYELYVMKGTTLDPFVAVTNAAGDPHNTGANALTFMASTFSTDLAAGTAEFFWVSDELIDLHTVSNLDKIVALDGDRPSYGADGSTVTGTAAKGYLTGDAAAWNDAGGLNDGSDSAVFNMTGAVEDVVGTVDLMEGVGDFASDTGWTLNTPDMSISGGVLVIDTTANFKQASRLGGGRVACTAGKTLDLEFNMTSLTTETRLWIKLKSYNSGGTGIDSQTTVFDTNSDGAITSGINSKTSVYTTPALAATLEVIIEVIASGFEGDMDDFKLLEQ